SSVTSNPITSSFSLNEIPLTPAAVLPNGRSFVSSNRINEACFVPIIISFVPSVSLTAINSSSSLKLISILPFLLRREKFDSLERRSEERRVGKECRDECWED